MKRNYKKIAVAMLASLSMNAFAVSHNTTAAGVHGAKAKVVSNRKAVVTDDKTKVSESLPTKESIVNTIKAPLHSTSSTTQQDSMSFGGQGSLTASVNSETGELLISYPVGSVPGIGVSPKLTLNYDNDSSQQIDNLGTGWSLNLTNYDISTHYLYVDGTGYYVKQSGDQMLFEGEHTSNNVSFVQKSGTLSDGRQYQYVIMTHAGSTEYLKTYTVNSQQVARVIQTTDNMGNSEYFYYGDETDSSSTSPGLLTSIKSNLGNEIKLSNQGTKVIITLPSVFGAEGERTVTITKGSNGVSNIAVTDGDGTTYNYGVNYQSSNGQYFITKLSYPSGMYANITSSINDSQGKYLDVCSTSNACSSSNATKMPVYEKVVYTDALGGAIHTLLNTTTNAEYGPNKHNFTGYPSVGLSSSKDMLLNGGNLAGYTYQTSQITNVNPNDQIKVISTLNHEHLVTEQDTYDGSNLIAKSKFTYDGETVGNENNPPPYSNLSLDTYTDAVQSSTTPYQFGKAGVTITTSKLENKYGEVTTQTQADGSKKITAYNDYDNITPPDDGSAKGYGAPILVVNQPASEYLKKDSSDTDETHVYPTYTQNHLTTDSYGHTVVDYSESGYITGSDGGTGGTLVPVYHTAMTYDSHGRILSKVLSFADGAPAEFVQGNIKTTESDYTYIDDATTSTNKALICGLFSSGSCPADIENNLDDIQAVITTQKGTAYDGKDYGSISTASIVDKGTGLTLYSFTDSLQSNTNGIAQNFQHVSSVNYDGFGRKVKTTDPLGEVSTMSYNISPNNNYITTIDPAGNTLRSYFDNFGKATKQTASDGTRTILMGSKTYDYDTNSSGGYGMVESSTDISGNIDSYFYNDSQEAMTDKKTQMAELISGVPSNEQYFYNYTLTDRVNSRQISFNTYNCDQTQCIDFYHVKAIDPKTGEVLHTYTLHADGATLPNTYSPPSNLQTDFNDSSVAQTIINGVDSVISAGNWISHTSMSYDGYHRMLSATKDVNSAGDTITINKHYNAIGQPTSGDNDSASNSGVSKLSSGDDDIQQRSYEYNLIGKIVMRELKPLNTSDADIFYRKQAFTYNPLGELISTVYSGTDESGKLSSETVFSNPTYDGEGKLTSFVNEGGYINHTKYDAIGRVIGSWVTDTSGALTVDPLGNTLKPTCSIYNNATGNLDYMYYDTSGNATSDDVCTATYDAPPAANSTNQLITYAYDQLTGDLLSKAYADAKKLSFDYSCVNVSTGASVSCSASGSSAEIYHGGLKSMTDITGMVTNYTYNAVTHPIIGSMLSATITNGSDTLGTTEYSYASIANQSCHAGQLCSQTIGNGDVEYYSYVYNKSTNPYEQVSQVQTVDKNGNVVDTIGYQYNYIGQVTQETVSDSLGNDYTLDNKYDASARLFEQDQTVGSNTTPTPTQYIYDVNGNIVKKAVGSNATTYSFNGLDQTQNQNVSFDAMGDELTNESQDNYYFNALNEPQLVGFKDQATGTVYEYSYYPDSLRASKCIKGDSACINYYYSGSQMVNATLSGETSHYLMANSRVQRLLTSDTTGKLLGDSSDDNHYYMANFKGTALGHIDASTGQLTSATQYTPYGAIESQQSTSTTKHK